MTSISAFVLVALLLGTAVQGAYLYFPTLGTQPEALARCQNYGMTLLELRNEAELNRWNTLKTDLFNRSQSAAVEPWLGLVHDGRSRYGYKSNYRWLDAGTVTFLTWPPNSREPNGLPREACIRVRSNHFGTWSCAAQTFTTVCQNLEFTGNKSTTEGFLRTYYRKTRSQTSSQFYRSSLGDLPPGDWLIVRPDLTSVQVDGVVSCLLLCGDSQKCVSRYQEGEGCTVMEVLQLSAIHNP